MYNFGINIFPFTFGFVLLCNSPFMWNYGFSTYNVLKLRRKITDLETKIKNDDLTYQYTVNNLIGEPLELKPIKRKSKREDGDT